MSELDNAINEHMAYIVFQEKRPFSFKDFLRFEVDGKEYTMVHGTFRNKISKLIKKGVVEPAFNSHISFYTLKGYKFGKSAITHDHTGVTNYNNNSIYRIRAGYLYELIMSLPFDKNSIHDIRLRFKIKGIWSMLYNKQQIMSYQYELSMNQHNKDIQLPTWKLNNILVRVTIHKTDTFSVIIACSLKPITIDFNGISILTEVLTRTEERISNLVKNIENNHNVKNDNNEIFKENSIITTVNKCKVIVPHYNTWMVTMWHFGADSMLQCAGEKFSISYKDGKDILLRVYTKQRKRNDTRIRIERQENPRKSIVDAINEKLHKNSIIF